MSAIELHARPSSSYDQKLAATSNLLRQAGELYQPLTQASSLGVEDMIITHLLHSLGIKSEVFVLQTGKLHTQTLDLLHIVQKQFGDQRTICIRFINADRALAAELLLYGVKQIQRLRMELAGLQNKHFAFDAEVVQQMRDDHVFHPETAGLRERLIELASLAQ